MRITSAVICGNHLTVELADQEARQEAVRFAYSLKSGTNYDITPSKRKTRSVDANAMCWVLCQRIAKAVSSPEAPVTKEDVYKRAIHNVGDFTPIPIKETAVQEFIRIWSAHGTGWIVDDVDASKLKGYRLLHVFPGSSTYDTAQMSRLIDCLMDECRNLGIETLTERERTLLLEDWDR